MEIVKTQGGSWLDWRDAWREMGRSEDAIAAEDSRRETAAEAQRAVFARGAGAVQARRRRVRERLHGFTRARFDARCERLARVSGYIVKALLRGWRREPLSARELFRAAWATCVGARLGSEAMARAWRDVWEWVRNIYLRVARERGVSAESVSESYLQNCADGTAEKTGASDGVGARESETGERPVKQCRVLTADAVCAAYGDFRETASPCSKGDVGRGSIDGRTERARADDAPTGRIPRYKGKLPGRCCWRIWETMDELRGLHWPATAHMWSAKHAFSWLASVLAAGKSLRAAIPLYYDALIAWYGRRVSSEDNYVPSGLYAQLYREALDLPDYRRCPSRGGA